MFAFNSILFPNFFTLKLHFPHICTYAPVLVMSINTIYSISAQCNVVCLDVCVSSTYQKVLQALKTL